MMLMLTLNMLSCCYHAALLSSAYYVCRPLARKGACHAARRLLVDGSDMLRLLLPARMHAAKLLQSCCKGKAVPLFLKLETAAASFADAGIKDGGIGFAVCSCTTVLADVELKGGISHC